ncbi:SGNH/GDSL hydrolase family protein [Rhodococcus sp. Eu-32]|uniref:SGNH/GDSL hydrolase family protein n=1 Tax=Rhodococcus sp. Eu-32 TaxID=1017319 RepID=UPI001402A5EE|nr:SGNH/GDSL hydrolase family protein [Rhodococcus sp. Eu-32]
MSGARRRNRSSRETLLPQNRAVIAVIVLVLFTVGVSAYALTRDYGLDPAEAAAQDKIAAEKFVQAEADRVAELDRKLNAQVVRPADRPLRVLFTGDSLTYGLYASTQDKGFRGVMVNELSKQGPVEAAASERSGAGAGVVASIVDVPDNLDLAIVELGTNDVGGQTPIPDFTATYGALLDKIRAKTPGVPLICVGTWGSAGGGFGSDPYNNVIEEQCTQRDGKFVTMYKLYPREDYRGPAGLEKFGGISDDFHPNDEGYRAIADTLLKRITFVQPTGA